MRDLSELLPLLSSRVLGQADAHQRTVSALQSAELNLNERGPRPKGAFLYMGSRGIGKTETAKAFSEYLYGPDNLGMFFMNEMKTAESKHLLTALLKSFLCRHPKGSTLLFDEIEKAHEDVIDLFISLLDEGECISEKGESIRIGNCYVVLTSNIGADRWGSMLVTKYTMMERFAYERARKKLRPELFNRLTETIVFRPLNQEVQIAILEGMLTKKLAHLEFNLNLRLHVADRVRAHLLRTCFTQAEGARRLRQELDRQLNSAVLPWALAKRTPEEGCFYYEPKRDQLVLR